MLKREIKDWPTKELNAKASSGEIDLDAEYQREIIWTKKDQELLIDSILKKIDIPKIYLAKFTGAKKSYECIDGKQRINTVMKFYNREITDLDKRKYDDLSPDEQKNFDEYEFTVSIIVDPDDKYVNELFRRLNLGDPLNTAKRLNSVLGDMRDFIFEKIGQNGPFIGNTKLSAKRFSRELAVAQMVFNSTFYRGDDFKRARWEELDDFFKKHIDFSGEDKTRTNKIEEILKKINNVFGVRAKNLRGRASLVSVYLFAEKLILENREKELGQFAKFYLELFRRIREENKLIRQYQAPKNIEILNGFYKNIQQASVEPYSIKRRHEFLDRTFEHFKKTGKIIGD